MVDMGTVRSSGGERRDGISEWNGREKIIRRKLAVGEKIVWKVRGMYWIRLKIAEDNDFKIRVSRFERSDEVVEFGFEGKAGCRI